MLFKNKNSIESESVNVNSLVIETDVNSINENIWYHINLGVLKEANEVYGLIFIVTDIIKEKLIEKKLRKQTEEINAMNQELQQAQLIPVYLILYLVKLLSLTKT